MPADKLTSRSGKPRIAYLIPYLRGFRVWVPCGEGGILALKKFVEPVLIVSQGDRAAAREKFPELELHVLPTVQAEDWAGTTRSMLRWMIPSIWSAGRLPSLRGRLPRFRAG